MTLEEMIKDALAYKTDVQEIILELQSRVDELKRELHKTEGALLYFTNQIEITEKEEIAC